MGLFQKALPSNPLILLIPNGLKEDTPAAAKRAKFWSLHMSNFGKVVSVLDSVDDKDDMTIGQFVEKAYTEILAKIHEVCKLGIVSFRVLKFGK